jgi:hypothetical protein
LDTRKKQTRDLKGEELTSEYPVPDWIQEKKQTRGLKGEELTSEYPVPDWIQEKKQIEV